MRSRTRSLLPVLAGLVALMTLGMPEGVAGQGKSACSKCVYTKAKDKEDPPITGCEPLTNRRYSPARVAELRTGLRRVTI